MVELYSGMQVARKVINTVPHDLGDPEEEPWIKVSICSSLKVVFKYTMNQCYGSGQIDVILVGPDLYTFLPNVKLKFTFSRKFHNTVQNVEIMTPMTPSIKQCELALLWGQFFFELPTCLKLGIAPVRHRPEPE